MRGLHIDPPPRVGDVQLGLPVGPLETKARTVSHCWMHLDSFLLVELPCVVSVGEKLKSLLLLRVTGPATIYHISMSL